MDTSEYIELTTDEHYVIQKTYEIGLDFKPNKNNYTMFIIEKNSNCTSKGKIINGVREGDWFFTNPKRELHECTHYIYGVKRLHTMSDMKGKMISKTLYEANKPVEQTLYDEDGKVSCAILPEGTTFGWVAAFVNIDDVKKPVYVKLHVPEEATRTKDFCLGTRNEFKYETWIDKAFVTCISDNHTVCTSYNGYYTFQIGMLIIENLQDKEIKRGIYVFSNKEDCKRAFDKLHKKRKFELKH